jgi:maltooligosyltrehalose synthase
VAVGCAVLLAAAFVGGRFWEHLNSKRQSDTAANAQPQQRVVVVVLTDHLDRTERLLVQLNHANSADKAENAQLQSEARELLASNRLYRVSASNEGDPALAGALDRLERVLAEIANDPHLTSADLDRVRSDMNTSGILFEVRVLLARKPNQESGPTSAKGVSI